MVLFLGIYFYTGYTHCGGMMGCVGVQQGNWVFMEIGDKEDGSASSNMGSHGLFF